MAKYLSAIRNDVRQLLRDEFVSGTDQDWEDDELNIHISHCLAEISHRCPNLVKEVLTTIENSKELDISSVEDLIYIDKLEYPTGQSPRQFRSFNWIDSDTIEIDTTLTPDEGDSSTLTGTVTFSSGSASITGSGTAFSSELDDDYHIKKSTGTRWYRIYSIESDTALTLAEASRDDGADTEDATQYCYETVYLYCGKVHTLTESSSTLTPALGELLIDGAAAYAASAWVNTMRARLSQATTDLTSGRALVNTLNVVGTPLTDYANYASRELSIADRISGFQGWANNKLALYRTELKGQTRPKTRRLYPKS